MCEPDAAALDGTAPRIQTLKPLGLLVKNMPMKKTPNLMWGRLVAAAPILASLGNSNSSFAMMGACGRSKILNANTVSVLPPERYPPSIPGGSTGTLALRPLIPTVSWKLTDSATTLVQNLSRNRDGWSR